MLILKVHKLSWKQEDYKNKKKRYYSPQNLDKKKFLSLETMYLF